MLVEFLIFVVVFYFRWYLEDRRNHKGFPPGPTRYPIIGTLPSLIGKSFNPAVLFGNLAKKYGDVILVSVGKWEAVVFNSYDTIIDILSHENAADRGAWKIPLLNDRQKGKNIGLVYGWGSPWTTLRQFTLRTLRDYGLGKSQIMDFVINEELENLMTHLDKVLDAINDKTILFHGDFELSVTNVVWRLVTGDCYSLDDPKMLKLLKMNNRISSGSNFAYDPSIWFPILRDIFPTMFARTDLQIALDELEVFARETVCERRAKGTYITDPKGFLDCFLQKVDENENNTDSPFNDEQTVFTILDLFQAGADTSSKTLEFAVLYMLLYPEVQRKVQQEIDSVVPENSQVALSHKSRLNYVRATILETYRFSSLVPLNIMRTASDDFMFHGHFIKRGTVLLANLQGHHYSEKVWGDPYTFRPERFLTPDGKIDLKLAETVLAFGAGRRVCVGRSLADATVFLYFTTLLRHYEFLRAPGKPDPTLKTTSAFLNIPKPFYVRIVKRKPTLTSS